MGKGRGWGDRGMGSQHRHSNQASYHTVLLGTVRDNEKKPQNYPSQGSRKQDIYSPNSLTHWSRVAPGAVTLRFFAYPVYG